MILGDGTKSSITRREINMYNLEKNTELVELAVEEIELVTGGNGPLSGAPGALPQPINGGGPLPVGPNPFG